VSSKADVPAIAADAWLCRIGERVLVTAVASGAPAQLEILVDNAIREMTFGIGDRRFALLQMPASSVAPSLAMSTSPMDVFLDAWLAPEGQGPFLKRLFGFAGMFRLTDDGVFAALVCGLRAGASHARARITLDCVDGTATAIATVASRAGLMAGDLLVETGPNMNVGTVTHVTPFLARDNPRQKLAAIRFAPIAPLSADYLLVNESGLVAVEATITRHVDLEAFHARHVRNDRDSLTLMALADEAAGAVVDRMTRRLGRSMAIHEPYHDVSFELLASVAVDNGLLVSGWFVDPDQRIEAVVAVDPGLGDTDIAGRWTVFGGRADLGDGERPVRRFVAFLPRSPLTRTPLAPPVVRVALSTGESHIVSAEAGTQDLLGKRRLILDSIAGHAFDSHMLRDVYAPALGPLQAAINARQELRDIARFGVVSRRKISLIIPLYKEIGFIRTQLMAFSIDPFIRENCEIVFVLDDPLIRQQVIGILEGSALVYPLDLMLVGLKVNGGYALANNLGVAQASGETLVLMNSDVIAERAGWLEQALQRLETLPMFSVVGPKLIYADKTLQHAGMYFYRMSDGNWQNFHYWKGYGADFAPANVERPVPAVTGACMILRKADYLAVGGFTSDYVVGDYEDSDLCLKLRQEGGSCHYLPSVRLFHFERQSMPKDEDQVDRGSTIYNRAIHTARWSDAIQTLMTDVKDVRHVG